MADHIGVKMTAFAGIDLQSLDAGGANALGVVGSLLVAFDHRDRNIGLQVVDGAHQQRGLARTWAGDEIQRQHAFLRESRAVLVGIGAVFRQNVALDLDDALLAHAGHMDAGQARAVIHRAVFRVNMIMVGVTMIMRVVMIVIVVVIVVMMMVAMIMAMVVAMGVIVVMLMAMLVIAMLVRMAVGMTMLMFVLFAFDCRRSASANRAHHSTSNSFTRISSPPVICTW